MTNITLKDLEKSEKLDKTALSSIRGGIAMLLPAVQAARESARVRGYGPPDTRAYKRRISYKTSSSSMSLVGFGTFSVKERSYK